MTKIRIFTTSDCPRCRMTINFLRKQHLKFDEINLDRHPQYRESLKSEGFTSAPVVFADGRKWSGFCPDKLRQLTKVVSR